MANKHKQSGFAALEALVIVVVVVSILAMVGYRLYKSSAGDSGQRTAQQTTSELQQVKYPTNIGWDKVDLLESDRLHAKHIQELAWRVLGFYLQNRQYPKNATEAKGLTTQDEPLIDPVTQAPYVVVDSVPGEGEVQYRLSMTCDRYNRNMDELSGYRENVYALMMKMSDGSFVCKSNID